MHRKLIFALVPLCLFLSSCGVWSGSLFSYQKQAATIHGTLESGENMMELCISLEDWAGNTDAECRNGTVTFLSPEELDSIAVEFSGSTVFILAGDLKVPIVSSSLPSVSLLSSLFCLDENDITGIESRYVDSVRETVVNVKNEEFEAVVVLDRKSGLPKSISADFDGTTFTLTVSEMEISD